MAANSNENSAGFADRDPEELFCLKWNDFTVRLKSGLLALQRPQIHFCNFSG